MSEVVFVGTSDAFGAGGRRQAAIVVRGPEGGVLLDCGPATTQGLNAVGVARDEIDAVLVSHFHGDHFGGIPVLLLACLYEDERTRPLRIAGPVGVEARVREAARALGFGLEHREWSFEFHFDELETGQEKRIGPVAVRTFQTHHQPESCPHGMVVNTGDRQIAYSGDTGWFDGLPDCVKGADLFICECTLCKAEFEFHLSLEELSDQRGRIDVGRVVLTHLGPEMRERRGGTAFELADDGLSIRL